MNFRPCITVYSSVDDFVLRMDGDSVCIYLFVCIKQVLLFLNDIFDTLLKALSDPSDEVICSWCLFLCLIISFSCIFMLNFYSNKKASFLLIAIFFWNSVCCTLAILQFFLATALKCIFTFNFLFY